MDNRLLTTNRCFSRRHRVRVLRYHLTISRWLRVSLWHALESTPADPPCPLPPAARTETSRSGSSPRCLPVLVTGQPSTHGIGESGSKPINLVDDFNLNDHRGWAFPIRKEAEKRWPAASIGQRTSLYGREVSGESVSFLPAFSYTLLENILLCDYTRRYKQTRLKK